MDTFDAYFATHSKVQGDCTRLIKDMDCLDRNLARPCLSCREFVRILDMYGRYARQYAIDDKRVRQIRRHKQTETGE